MKKFSFTSVLGTLLAALAILVLGGIGAQTFAYDSAHYTGNFTPSGCTPTSMNVVNYSGWTFSWGNLDANTIYVFEAGTYTISSNITLNGNCVSMVTNGDTAGNVVFNFTNGGYITSNGFSNLLIAGFDANHMFEADLLWSRYQGIFLQNGNNAVIRNTFIKNTVTNGAGIAIMNFSGSTISNNILSGHRSIGLYLYNTDSITISNNTFVGNKDGLTLSTNSINNTISNNTATHNTDRGIHIQAGSTNTTISSNTVTYNTNYGILVEGATGCTISSNTITNQAAGIWLTLSTNNNMNNTVTNNTITANAIGVNLDAAKNNAFSNNTISSNTTRWLYMLNAATGNTFTSDTFSANTNINVYLSNAHNNQFINTTIQNSARGIDLSNSNYNLFSGSNVTSNTEGAVLTTADNNTFKLTNNTNGISLYAGSDNNNILNTQVVGQNNIAIYNGTNNIITWGLFSAASTTTTAVNIALKNNQLAPTYSIAWAGLSWAYAWSMGWTTQTLAIELTWGNGTKDIVVTYNNGNKQYDTITLWSTPSGGNSGGWGGWGGGTPTCTTTQLVCSGGVRVRVTWVSCQWGNLGNACTVGSWSWGGTGTLPVGSIAWSHYSTEMNNAYLRAYAYGITTMPTIQQANMWGNLIRAHMAKMISNFAITLWGFTPDTDKECTFDDTANQSAEMKFYIKLSCQLGLMGVGIDSFDPKGQVTRAQFGTIMSRLIRWSMYDGWTPYYTAHLTALKNAGIITQTVPTSPELRWYVMIMMKRAYEWGFLNN